MTQALIFRTVLKVVYNDLTKSLYQSYNTKLPKYKGDDISYHD